LPNHAPFLTVLGEFDPLNVVGHRAGPKKVHPCVIARNLNCVKIGRRVTSVGESGEKQ